jgi:hypothetical protein
MMDSILEAWVSANIERAKASWILGRGERWQPGKKLKLLFAGYNGTRNTGSDVRPEETVRQLRHILGADNVEFSVMSQNFKLTDGYFKGSQQVHLPDIFPPFIASEVPKHHGVVVVEGSAFKSKFANALTTMIVGSLGTAAAQNKLAVGYGSEAGHMDPAVAKMCGRYCKNSLIITRNEESRTVLRKLGVPTELGTDTAWTFEPQPPEYGRKVLQDAGWDGQLPVLIVCPINPFWWPVKPSLTRYAVHAATGAYKESHYRTVYFHKSGAEVDAAFERYLTAIANALRVGDPVLVGARVAACGVVLIQRSDLGLAHLVAQRGQFVARFHLHPQVIEAWLHSALGDGEVDPRIVQHPLGVVVLQHRGGQAENGRVEADVRIQVIDRYMHVKAFHDLLLADLRFGAGWQQRVNAVSMTVRHSCGMPWQQF